MKELLSALFCLSLATVSFGQVPTSSPREIPLTATDVKKRVDEIIERANQHFRIAKLALEDNKPKQGREEFDKAVDEILLSGLDVRANDRLNAFYLELVERIHREEIPLIKLGSNATPGVVYQASPSPTPVIGFKEQKLDTSNDRLSQPIAQPPKDAILVQGFWLGMDLE